MRKLSTFALIIVFVVLATAIALTQTSQPAAQPPTVDLIPNLVGAWSAEGAEVGFGNPADPLEAPHFDQFTSRGAPVVYITDQVGRTFAGYFAYQPGQHDKLTGVVTEDGTVTVQLVTVFQQSSPNRGLLWGKVSPLKNPILIKVLGHGFEEYGEAVHPSFSSFYYTFKKVR
jgi:hypothetical protein